DQEALSGEIVSSEANAYDATVETALPTYTSVVTNVNSNIAGFWQAVPSLYSKTTKSYPLILFIHGIGELGTEIGRMNCCGLPRHLRYNTFPPNFNVGGANYSFIVMAPQFKVRPSAADVQSAIDYMKARYRIDPSRIYVTGLSMGGGSTWDWSAVYGQNAAAIVPVCGGTAPTDALCKSIASKNLPIWGIYSYKDAVVPASWGTTFFNTIDKYNTSYAGVTKLTIYSDADHNTTWGRAFDPVSRVDGYNIYEWMLLYKRGSTATPPPTTTTPPPTSPTTGNTAPIATAGPDQTIPASWNWFPTLNANASKDPDGYVAKFAWSVVSGPSAVTLATPNTGATQVTGWKTGTYVFRVAVTDNKGAVSYDDVAITISATATSATTGSSSSTGGTTTVAGAPIAKAGDDQSYPKSWNWFPTLNANYSTDPDGWITKFAWSQVSGPNTVSLATPNTGATKVTGWTVGTYVFRVAVTDNSGKTSYDDVAITITNN
ncbi:MAG: dienelactone hydrolase family protein, partial [Chitinophagaceae bacterium]|nr:dienelactone hydrolase family protein [Chitinophagaceae bacterium]